MNLSPEKLNISPTLHQTPQPLNPSNSNLSWVSPLHRNFSRNLENEEWSDDQEAASPEGNRSQIDLILRKSKAHLAERDADYEKSHNPSFEKQIKKALSLYFDGLNEKFLNQAGADTKFMEDVKQYIIETSGEQGAKVMQESDGLLWKSLHLADNLSILAQKTAKEKAEKLKLYISLLATQLGVHNQKYIKTKQNISKGEDEKKFLQRYTKAVYKKTHRFYQVDKILKESKITLEITSIKQFAHKYSDNSSSWHCEVKIDGTLCGKTSNWENTGSPVWNDAIVIEISNDQMFEAVAIEIYESSSEPKLIGECYVTLHEILENTLFNKIFRVKLPIIPISKEVEEKPGKLSGMTEQDVKDYIQSIAFERDNIGLLKVSFDVNLDPNFLDTIEEIRVQRLENLDFWAEDNAVNLEEQFEFLKFSLAPVTTIEVDKELGILSKEGIKGLGAERARCGLCGIDLNKTCNIF